MIAGTRIGPYEVLGALGAGGMGEVYRARDTRLGREVAIKTLPPEFTADAERLARFEREARLLAALNHANIAGIHGLDESDGRSFLVLELVEGETLAEKLAAGPLPPDEALAFGRQIAGALEAAHEKGIVHRDLKPANVKITPSGKVKVLDFGLAKALGDAERGTDLSVSPTVTTGGTKKGVILGTAPYMSPEQARGKPVDKRTDIWSFGCVLYEALTGRRAFEGETVSDVIVSVLSREPDWSALPQTVPARARDVLRRCLQKDPERRLHDIADARLELEDAAEPVVAMPAAPSPKSRFHAAPLLWTAIASAALAALATWRLTRPEDARPAATVERLARLTRDPGRSEGPTWSPDGSLLAYASDRNGDLEIYVRRGERGQDVNVTNDKGQDFQPAFSPDGSSIAFVSTRSSKTGLIRIGGTFSSSVRTYGGDLWIVPALGGGARRLAPDANLPAWRPDGRAILYVTGPENRRAIREVPPEGGPSREVLRSREASWEINRMACSPDGRWVSFEDTLEGIFLMPYGGGKPRQVATGYSHGWDFASGRLYFVLRDPEGASRIQFLRYEPESGVAAGAPETLSLQTSAISELAVSRDGLQIAVAEAETSRNLTRIPLAQGGGAPAGPEEPLSSGSVTDHYPEVSPDGRRVAYSSDLLGHQDIWILDLTSGRRERLQLPGADIAQTSPVWMPDGRRLLIGRMAPDGNASNWMVAVDGSGAEELFRRSMFQGSAWSLQPSPDGRTCVYPEFAGGVQQVFRYDFSARKSTQLTHGSMDSYDMVFSPDGRSIALTALKDGAIQLFLMPAAGGALKQLTTGFERMRHPFFSPDGKWIYIQPSHRNISRVRADGGSLEPVTRFPEGGLFLEEPTISPDGRYLYYCRSNGGSSLWLLALRKPVRNAAGGRS